MRIILVIVAIGVAVWILLALLGGSPEFNLLLISVDTLRPDHLGCYGYTDIRTPNIDRLAAEGTRFTDVTSAVPLTLPSHTTILTGLYPPSHGIRDNAYMALPREIGTLAETLRDEGYSTFAVVAAFVLDSRYGLDQGFDIYDDDLSGGRQPREFNYTEITADEVTRKSVAYLRQTKEPFFAFVHYYDPHTTYDPPEPYGTIYKARPYDGEIAYTDQAIGRLIDYLREENLLERTLVVLVSDHGEGLGQHDEPTHGVLVYQATLHVPLIIRAPEASHLREILSPGSAVETPVSLVDIHDSVLDMLGIGGGPETDGESFLPRVRHKREEGETCYFESLYPHLAYRWSPLRGLRRGAWKYILAPREELYDLGEDPGEANNLADREPEMVHDLRDRLAALAGAMEKRSVPPAGGPGEEELRKLHALGYLSGGRSAVPAVLDTEGADPKAIMARFAPLMGSGEDAFAAGDLEAALGSFSRIIAMDPGNPQARIFRARVLTAMGRPDEAADEYARVIEIDPANSTPYFQLGNIAQGRGRLDQALAYYEQAFQLVPGSPEALANMGSIMMEKGALDSAATLLGRALEEDPLNKVALLNMALVYNSRGAQDEALRLFRRTLELDPESVKAMANIAAIYASRGLVDTTIKYLETARSLEPANATILANLGNAYRQKGMIADAEACYLDALEGDPGNVLALFGLAAVRAGQGRIADAETLLRRLLALRPDFTPAQTALSNLSHH
jgi:arylsulfatase A-like enzyme/Tfp pilus assembly protein PilF